MTNNIVTELTPEKEETTTEEIKNEVVSNTSEIKEVKKEPLPKSKYNGVSYTRSNKKWSAKVLLNPGIGGFRTLKHIGYFEDDYEAAVARNKFIEDNELICRKSKID